MSVEGRFGKVAQIWGLGQRRLNARVIWYVILAAMLREGSRG